MAAIPTIKINNPTANAFMLLIVPLLELINPLCRLKTLGLTLPICFSFSVRTYRYDQNPRKQIVNMSAAKVSQRHNGVN